MVHFLLLPSYICNLSQIKLSGIVKVMKELMAAFGEKIELYTLDDSVTLADASRTLQQINFQAAAVNTQLSELFNLDELFN